MRARNRGLDSLEIGVWAPAIRLDFLFGLRNCAFLRPPSISYTVRPKESAKTFFAATGGGVYCGTQYTISSDNTYRMGDMN